MRNEEGEGEGERDRPLARKEEVEGGRWRRKRREYNVNKGNVCKTAFLRDEYALGTQFLYRVLSSVTAARL